jgi:hypothetical protein
MPDLPRVSGAEMFERWSAWASLSPDSVEAPS